MIRKAECAFQNSEQPFGDVTAPRKSMPAAFVQNRPTPYRSVHKDMLAIFGQVCAAGFDTGGTEGMDPPPDPKIFGKNGRDPMRGNGDNLHNLYIQLSTLFIQ